MSINIWSRQPKESAKAFEAFGIYLELGTDRSQEEVSRRLSKSRQIISRWSARFNWVNRAAAYDSHLALLEEIEREKLVAKSAERWHKRREAIREEGFEIYEKLKAKAEQMLQFPLATITKTDNGHTTIIHPVDWNFNTAARLMETAVKIGRLSVDLSTDNIDVSKLTPEQLDAIIAGKPLSAVVGVAGEGAKGEDSPPTSERIN